MIQEIVIDLCPNGQEFHSNMWLKKSQFTEVFMSFTEVQKNPNFKLIRHKISGERRLMSFR